MTYSTTQKSYIQLGAEQDATLAKQVSRAIGVTKRRVESKRHSIFSGPPGIGKTYTTAREIQNSGKQWITFGPGSTDANIAAKLAYNVRNLADDEELVVLIDDADDIIFKDKKSMNLWKLALAKQDPEYRRDIDMSGQINKLRKQGKDAIADAIEYYQEEGEIGVSIPLDQVRFVVLCNKNYEDPKEVHASKRTDVEAIIDRVRYTRLEFEWKTNWGWLAHILSNSQPFADENVNLSDEEKQKIAGWMWDKWEIMRNTSYRTVEEMAEYILEDPIEYENDWNIFLKVR